MNCANHPDVPKAAFCRTCGKALCANCSRDVRGVIYCENCLAERLEGVHPPEAAYQQTMGQGAGVKVPASPGAGPHPTVAGILGAIPFGIGAVYNGQYAKALAHLLIFVGLIYGVSNTGDWGGLLFGLGIAFFVFYQISDAVRTAKALQAGQPAPDPLGLAQTFGGGGGDKVDTSKIPIAAVVLIGLGVLFLLDTLGLWSFDANRFWPIILIVIGGWLFARRFGLFGYTSSSDCDRCRARCLMGPAIMVTLGVLFLLQEVGRGTFGFHRTWPLLLVVIGVIKVLQSSASTAGHIDTHLPPTPPGAPPSPVSGPVTGEVVQPSSEVRNG